ncbi:MAG: tyrosine protein kinase [Burkholderiales bacterium PBB5]|nr:MAG: tyrosine protein kinase [Burkholderiales bacterium PBB5]
MNTDKGAPDLNKAPGASSVNDAHGGGDRTLGEIIRDTRNLSAEQVEKILVHQRAKHLRFGEAAIALGYVSADDVLAALAQQFNYPYATPERRNLSPELVALNQPFSVQAEAFRGVRSQVVMRTAEEGQVRHAIAVISPSRGDGRSFVAANLAVVLAQLGGRTLLVDADLRGPRQHSIFGLDAATGLSRILVGRAGGQVIQQIAGVPNLYVLPAGAPPPNPLELIERPAFALLLREMASKFDHVVVDTSAAEYGADAAVTAARCGSTLMVARNGRSRLDALQALAQSLSGSAARVVGVITNDH